MKWTRSTRSALALLILFLLTLCSTAFAQTPPDVPDTAIHEIARRGSHVEQTGTIRSGLMAEALAPPIDDSAKWFLTLVYRPNEQQSMALKQVIETSPAMRAWVHVREPSHSTLHYQVRSIDDGTQRDWLRNLQPAIQKNGLPCVVIQPPHNGRFGKNETIVKMLHGVPAGASLKEQGEALSVCLRDGIVAYVQAIERPRGGIGVPPPFETKPRPRDEAPPADAPVEWPVLPPPAGPTGPPQSPLPTTPASTTDTLTGVLVFLAGIAATLGLQKLATGLRAATAFAREIAEIKSRLPPRE